MIALAVASAFILNCSEPQKPKTLTGVATFVKGTVILNEAPMKVGAKVKESDVIHVKKKSGAIIQFSTGALITLKSKTKLEVSRLKYGPSGKPVVALSQSRGSTFSKIVPNKAKYSIKTPTAVAGVRGTSFSVSVKKGKKSEIRLLKGKVEVSRVSKKAAKVVEAEPVVLEAGQKIETTEKKITKAKKLSEKETKSLETYDKEVKFVPEKTIALAPEKMAEEIKATQQQVVDTTVVDQVINEKIVVPETKEEAKEQAKKPVAKKPKKKLTLADLRAKYGKLTKIITHNKREYVGGDWKQVGDYHYIRTVGGKKKVKTSDVYKVLPMD